MTKLLQLPSIKKVFFGGIILSSQFIFAQTNEILSDYKTRFPGNNIVQSLKKETVKIDLLKSKPTIKHFYTDEYLVITNQGAQMLSEDYIEFSTLEKIENIVAYTLSPTEKGSKKIPVTDFKTVDVQQNGMIFYDGSKKTEMLFQGLTEGALRHLSYENISTDYQVPIGFGFSSSIPIAASIYEIDHDSSIHLLKKEFHFEGYEIKFEEKNVKNRRIWRWTIENPKTLKIEDNAPSIRYFSPSVFAQISHINTKKGRENVLGTLEDLFTLYKKSIEDILALNVSDELKLLAQDLVKDKNTDFEKVKAIYYWVQNNIKYIAFEEGVNGYIPRPSNQVFEKKYGDCKDMASLIYTMTNAVGLKTYISWIGSRDLPYKYTEFPSSLTDNHMIAVYFDGEKPYFLDATSSFQPIDFPTSFILGKETFLYKNEKDYQVINVTIPSNTQSVMIDTARIQLDNRKIIGKSNTKLTGYYNIFINERFKDIAEDKLIENMSNSFVKGNNSFKINAVKVEGVSKKDENLLINYDFTIDNYNTSFENETYVNMVLEKNVVAITEVKLDRVAPIEFDFLSHDQYTVELEIPAGMKIKSVPKDVKFSAPFVDLQINYKQINSKIYMTLELDLKELLIYKEDFKTWNDFIKVLKKGTSETIVIVKN